MRCLPAGILKQEVLEPAPLLLSLFENTQHKSPKNHLKTSCTMVTRITKNIIITWMNTRFTKSKWSRGWQEASARWCHHKIKKGTSPKEKSSKEKYQKKYSIIRKVLLPPFDQLLYVHFSCNTTPQWRLLRLITNSRCLNKHPIYCKFTPRLRLGAHKFTSGYFVKIHAKVDHPPTIALVMPTKLYSLLLPRNQQT